MTKSKCYVTSTVEKNVWFTQGYLHWTHHPAQRHQPALAAELALSVDAVVPISSLH